MPAILAVVVLLAACGGGGGTTGATTGGQTEPGGGGGTSDACALLTEDEVAAATGSGVASVEPEAFGEVQRCNWNIDDDPELPSTITVNVWPSNGRAIFEETGPGGPSASATVESVEGIGDDAYYDVVANSPTLYVLVGDQAFFVQFVDGNLELTDVGESAVRELAPKAAARL